MSRLEKDLHNDLVLENRKLRTAFHKLLDEIEKSQLNINVSEIRKEAPSRPADNTIKPPWERQGYKNKQAWMKDQ